MSVQTLDEAMKERAGRCPAPTEEGAVAQERTLDIVAAEIRALTANALNTIVEIGRRMVEAKEMLPHGEFGAWIKENTGYSSSTANNFMRIFEAYADPQGSLFGASVNCQTFGNLTYSKALALLEVPADEREKFVETHDVDEMSTRELQAAIKERDEARERAEGAELALADREEAMEGMKDKLQKADEQMAGLKEELEELKSRPKDVAVEKVVDQEAIDAAVKEALEGQQKELDAARKKLETAEKKAEKAEKAAARAKEEAESAGKGNSEELEEARREAEKAREESERLRKELKMADGAVATFRAHFAMWQGLYGNMEKDLEAMGQETADKLRGAVKAQIEAWGKEAAE